MNYNYQSIEGSCCTGLYATSGSGDAQRIHWSSIWDIDAAVNPNLVKGYSFIGLTQNLQTRLNAIASIPSTYTWTVSNSTAYKGKGHFTSSLLPRLAHIFIARQRGLRFHDLRHQRR